MSQRAPVMLWLILALTSACATSAVQQHVAPGRSEDATAVGARDATLSWDPDALYEAAAFHASPGRPTYDPDRAAELLSVFIERFPSDARRRDASERLALVNEVRALRAELRALKAIDLARPPQ